MKIFTRASSLVFVPEEVRLGAVLSDSIVGMLRSKLQPKELRFLVTNASVLCLEYAVRARTFDELVTLISPMYDRQFLTERAANMETYATFFAAPFLIREVIRLRGFGSVFVELRGSEEYVKEI